MAYSADRKPGELTALTSLATDDVIVVGDTSDASEVAKGITKANLITDLTTSFAAAGHNHTGVYAPVLGTDDNYVTDAEKIVIGNTSGTNTGDNAVNSNYSGLVTNATHTGDVTGSGALTIDKTAITGKTAVTAVGTDYVLISDTSDTGNLKKALVSDIMDIDTITQLPATGVVNGSNLVFTFTQVPSYIVVDGLWLRPISANGTIYWTNISTTITMINPPFDDIFGVI